jgi:hypothetical protein
MASEHGFPSCPNSTDPVETRRTGRATTPANARLPIWFFRHGCTWNTASTRHHHSMRTGASRTRDPLCRAARTVTLQTGGEAARLLTTYERDESDARLRQPAHHGTRYAAVHALGPMASPTRASFAEGHHGAERYRHAFSVTMAAFKQPAQALPKTSSRQSLLKPYCGTERQLIGTCTNGTIFGTDDGYGS